MSEPTSRRRSSAGIRGILKESIRLCPAQVACEDARLSHGREVCRACEKALKRRARGPQPPRGEYLTHTLEKKRTNLKSRCTNERKPMPNEYVRPASHGPMKDWRLVTLPEFGPQPTGTYLVYGTLADELDHLLSRGRVREAWALFSWFNDASEGAA